MRLCGADLTVHTGGCCFLTVHFDAAMITVGDLCRPLRRMIVEDQQRVGCHLGLPRMIHLLVHKALRCASRRSGAGCALSYSKPHRDLRLVQVTLVGATPAGIVDSA